MQRKRNKTERETEKDTDRQTDKTQGQHPTKKEKHGDGNMPDQTWFPVHLFLL